MKNKKNSGFTLVECIVAMAVLSICSLLLAMILSVTVNQRNENMQLERDIDSQVDKLNGVVDSSDTPVLNDYNQEIVFQVTEGGSSSSVSVPKNGDNGADVKTKYYQNDNVKISSIDYNFDGYSTPTGDGSDDGDDDDDDDDGDTESAMPNYGSNKLGGAAKISGNVNIIQNTVTGHPNRYQWKVSFTASSNSQEESFKISLPTGADIVRDETSATNVVEGSVNFDNLLNTNSNLPTVRVCPKGGSVTTITVQFDLPDGSPAPDLGTFFNDKGNYNGAPSTGHIPFTK